MKKFLGIAVILGSLSLASSSWTEAAYGQKHSSSLSFGQAKIAVQAKPAPAPKRWRGLIGEYGPDDGILYILEKDGRLCALFKGADIEILEESSNDTFKFSGQGIHAGQIISFTRGSNGRAKLVRIEKTVYSRRQIEPENGAGQLLIKPVRPVPELIKEALDAEPPKETGEFRSPDLVELKKLVPAIKLDIRYATTNNLFGTVFYSEARAFMQRPAAESLVRVDRKLKGQGYGLLIQDAYRPWYVTKVFWDATPQEKKIFVADPAKGSRHNRGAAVDLTLFTI